uniref:Failed axon connections n=1 Tax=Daphnia magna TaxID=35525 RepID=A0A0P6G316_9CRUS
MAAEVENPPAVPAAEEKKEEAPVEAAAEVPAVVEEAVEKPAEEVKEAPKEAAKEPAPKKPNVFKQNFEKDVVYLYQFARTTSLPSLSPYVLKVETWLRLTGLKYENVDHKFKLYSKKGQLPFVEVNGQQIFDSSNIIKELSQKFEKDIDAGLSNEQKTISHAMISMVENHLTFVIMAWRAKNPGEMVNGYKINFQQSLGSKIPNAILNFLFKINYGHRASKKVKAQGIGVHKPDEIVEMGKEDLKALSELLADKPFFFGDEPTLLDVVVFASTAQIYFISDDAKYALKEFMVEQCANLVGHVSRIKERCFSDWDEICNNLELNPHLPKPEPEVKENKEGADTEKAAEQDKESDKELVKEKVDEKIDENKEKEAVEAAS